MRQERQVNKIFTLGHPVVFCIYKAFLDEK